MVTNLQILGMHAQAEKDELVKSVMHLRNAQIEEGYTADVVVSRKVSELFFVNLARFQIGLVLAPYLLLDVSLSFMIYLFIFFNINLRIF